MPFLVPQSLRPAWTRATLAAITLTLAAPAGAAAEFRRAQPGDGTAMCVSLSTCGSDLDCDGTDSCVQIDLAVTEHICIDTTTRDLFCCDTASDCPDRLRPRVEVTCERVLDAPDGSLFALGGAGWCVYQPEKYCDFSFATVSACRLNAEGAAIPWNTGDCDSDGTANGVDPDPCDRCIPVACDFDAGMTFGDDAGTIEPADAGKADAGAATGMDGGTRVEADTVRFEGGGSCAVAGDRTGGPGAGGAFAALGSIAIVLALGRRRRAARR